MGSWVGIAALASLVACTHAPWSQPQQVGNASEAAFDDGSDAVAPGTTKAVSFDGGALPEQDADAQRWVAVVEDLELAFTDPVSDATYRIVGPYRMVASGDREVEIEGVDPRFLRAARLRLMLRGEAVWALARIDDQEFLTRIR